jgi:hypothetical protein
MRIPDVIYIGQQKTGSTFLRSYFSQHPGITWRRYATMFQVDPFVQEKYLVQFADEKVCDCLVDMYESLAVGYHLGESAQWDAAVALNPESTLDGRLMIPGQRNTAERIRATLPDARVLLTLRNQVDWLRSNYLHYILGLPSKRRRFADFVQTREGKLLLAAGAYDHLLILYRELFGPERVHVILLEDVVADEANVLRGLCEFLGVDYVPFDPAAREYNTGIGPGRGALVRAYSALGISDATARRLRPWFSRMEGLAADWLNTPALSAEEEAMVHAYYAVSNYNTSRILGRDLQPLGYAC